jgi:hypothetical protein
MERRLDLNHGPSATEAASQAVLTRAHVVHAAAALYLGIGNRELRGVLDVGVSLADVAEWQGGGVEGLKRALQNALGRTGDDHATGLVALVDQIVDVAQEGAGVWQELVENLIDSQGRQEQRLAAAAG